MKKLQGWNESTLTLDQYLQVGDSVDEEMADYFVNVLPPATMSGILIQVGEPVSEINGKNTFATLLKVGNQWVYQGNCFRGCSSAPSL